LFFYPQTLVSLRIKIKSSKDSDIALHGADLHGRIAI
jgi:hypothetical protein